jgi:hypothetical protein
MHTKTVADREELVAHLQSSVTVSVGSEPE